MIKTVESNLVTAIHLYLTDNAIRISNYLYHMFSDAIVALKVECRILKIVEHNCCYEDIFTT